MIIMFYVGSYDKNPKFEFMIKIFKVGFYDKISKVGFYDILSWK